MPLNVCALEMLTVHPFVLGKDSLFQTWTIGGLAGMLSR